MGNYTLLADENCSFSRTPALQPNFRAHLMFNVLTNGAITLSDNQAMSSPHVRLLMRRDGVMKEMLKESFINLAVRENAESGLTPLDEVFDMFLREKKLPRGFTKLAESPEIAFMQEHGTKIGWSYSAVRTRFTNDCKDIIFDQLGRQNLPENQIDAVKDIIAHKQDSEDGGLGRNFLRDQLPNVLAEHGILKRAKAKKLLSTWTDAVYLSNLPKTIGLNPIYAEEHSESFQILRGRPHEFRQFEDDYDLRPRLHASHFIQGLNQLDIDDIYKIQQTPAYKAFSRLSQSDGAFALLEELHVVYGELNMIIEDHIIDRFRNLMLHSPAPDPRKLRRQYGVAFEHGSTILMDVLSIATAGVLSLPGIFGNLIVDAIRERIDPARPHLDAARRQIDGRRFAQYLETKGQAGTIGFVEEVALTQSFKKEVMVR